MQTIRQFLLRRLAAVLALCILLSCLPPATAAAPAPDPGTVWELQSAVPEGLEYTMYTDYVFISGYTGSAEHLEIPAEIGGLPVKRISSSAFRNCSTLKSISLPASIEYLEQSHFGRCSNLRHIYIDEENPYYADIDGVLFDKAGTMLICFPRGRYGSYTVPDGVKTIGEFCFSNCDNLVRVDVADSVNKIGRCAFWDCENLVRITLPASAQIGESAFQYCPKLAAVKLPYSMTNIVYHEFRNCSGLEWIQIPESVTSIAYYSFTDCTQLTDVYFTGTEEQWSAISFEQEGEGNEPLLNANLHFNSYGPALPVPPDYPDPEEPTEPEPTDPTDPPVVDNQFDVTVVYDISAEGISGMGSTKMTYKDSYFWDASTDGYNHSLATLSLGMAMSAVTVGKGNAGDEQYIVDFLSALGCDDIRHEKFDDNASTDDTCAYAYGLAYLESCDTYLLPVAIRGFGYGQGFSGEWVSNFHVVETGYDGYAAGFKIAADGVFDSVYQYINECEANGIPREKIKVWVSGFSRAAAISNLLGARLNADSGIPAENLYIYTFATPATVKKANAVSYANIYNIVYDIDVVPRVPLSSWGYSRYGTTLYLPTYAKGGAEFNTKVGVMYQYFEGLLNSNGAPDDLHYHYYNLQDQALDLLMDYMDDIVANTDVYHDSGYQQLVMDALENMDSVSLHDLLRFLLKDHEDLADEIFDFWINHKEMNAADRAAKSTLIVTRLSGVILFEDDNTPLKGILSAMLEMFVNYQKRADKGYSGTCVYDTLFDMIGDVGKEMFNSRLLMQHWPETYLAWMRAGKSMLSTSSYKRVSVKCPVDVVVYNSAGTVVARVTDDVVDTTIADSLCVSVNAYGEKDIYLPEDDVYRIEITAREDGELDIVTASFDADKTCTGTTCFIDVQMEQAQVFQMDAEHDTVVTNETVLEPDAVSDETPAPVTITVKQNLPGIAFGAGSYMPGETVELIASDENTYGFDGWYLNETLVTELDSYVFSAVEDLEFEASFHLHAYQGDVCSLCGYQRVVVIEHPFTDVKEGAFYYKPVIWAVKKGITSGMTETTFAPDNQCTRGQVVTFLWRAAGKPEPRTTNHPFVDVSEKAFYYKAMLWAVENGITSGMDATHFAPDAFCSRAQVVTFLYRAKGKPAITNTEHPFTDVSATGFYYRPMLWAVENGITSGMSATTFAPDRICTRGQVVTFLYRTFNN